MMTPASPPVLWMIGTHTVGPSGLADTWIATPASATWESAERVVYYPMDIAAVCVVRRVWWANGATTTGGATVEVGVYADAGHKPGVKLISGSATQGTASEVQFVDVTDTTLAPGPYWLALMMSSATNTTGLRSSSTSVYGSHDVAYRFEQASANPLPSTATPVESSASNVWVFGFATTASP